MARRLNRHLSAKIVQYMRTHTDQTISIWQMATDLGVTTEQISGCGTNVRHDDPNIIIVRPGWWKYKVAPEAPQSSSGKSRNESAGSVYENVGQLAGGRIVVRSETGTYHLLED